MYDWGRGGKVLQVEMRVAWSVYRKLFICGRFVWETISTKVNVVLCCCSMMGGLGLWCNVQ